MKITQINNKNGIIDYFLKNSTGKSSEVHAFLTQQGINTSLVTIKRSLSALGKQSLLKVLGTGPATSYEITNKGRLLADINPKLYCKAEPDKRYGSDKFNFDLIKDFSFNPFEENEIQKLESATAIYKEKINGLSNTLHEKELERFVIELSWKSSKIEGNTYTLLDTEKLILQGIEAPNHTKNEAVMILNHKNAFSYIYDHRDSFKNFSKKDLEEVHSLLIKDLDIPRNIREKQVGITGSKYLPLDNKHQISEAIDELIKSIKNIDNNYAKALITLLGLSYIQPFEDGNKRTARLMTNAVLLAYGLSPLSYRNVDEEEYREALLLFYEINSLIPFKKIFIEQYEFATKNYSL